MSDDVFKLSGNRNMRGRHHPNSKGVSGDVIHVYPNWQDHDTESENCFCLPSVETYPNGRTLVIHNEIKEC